MQNLFLSSPVLVVLVTGHLAAQSTSNTLPKGWDTKEGIVVGTTTNSSFWAGFDSTATLNPSKTMYLYDSKDFPWDPKKPKVIAKLSFRRDGSATNTAVSHTTEWVVIMSTSSVVPGRANFNWYDGNHGTNRTEVYGTVGKPKTVTFPATAAPKPPATAPFNVSLTLDKAFIVPANAKTLVIEIRSYKVTGNVGWWRADSVRYPGTGYVGSTHTLLNTDHCVTPQILFHARVCSIGSNFFHVFRTFLPPGGDPFIAWAGANNTANPFKFPGTKCNVHVFPVLYAVPGMTLKSGQYAMMMDYGTIPNNTAFVGVTVPCQGIVANKSYPGGVALTRAFTQKIGSAYDPKVTQGSQIYSYGPNTIMYHGSSPSALTVIPDKEKYGRYFYRRHVIIKIN